jgi:DNA-binding transcriptional regulator LsrR (DeoR family)
MSDEREMFEASLPPEDDEAWAAFEAKVFGRKPDCPSLRELIELAEGKADTATAEKLQAHLPECDYCRAVFEAYRCAQKEPAKPAEPAVPSQRSKLRRQVARQFSRGVTVEALREQTGLEPDAILRLLCEARDRGLLRVRGPMQGPGTFLEVLRGRGPTLHNVTVIKGWEPARVARMAQGDWDQRIHDFGYHAAPYLLDLLLRASHVGFSWGETPAAVIEAVDRICEDGPLRGKENPLVCVATVGGVVGELRPKLEASSSRLARLAARLINGDEQHVYTQTSVRALITAADRTAVQIIKDDIASYENYQAIFGDGKPGVVDRLDALVTACGSAETTWPFSFWVRELAKAGISLATLSRIAYGDIGGVFLKRKGLNAADQALFEDIQFRWTGITFEHIRQCARRSPGVLLFAVGAGKAAVVLKSIELGLVTELLIDEDLALALWDLVDPRPIRLRRPRTLPVSPAPSLPLKPLKIVSAS